jgi:hypothetical protein
MMNDTFCSYDGRRDEALVGYLYDDIDPVERATFERHLNLCAACRAELDALAGVRVGLAEWAAPEVAAGVGGTAPRSPLRLVEAAPRREGWRRFSEAPVWLQAAAAMLVVAASLGIANLNVTYSKDGFRVTTGWMPSTRADVRQAQSPATLSPDGDVPWRADLTALEERVTHDIAEAAARPVDTPAPATADDAVLKQVRALIQESERRQQRELALRVAEVARDAQAQRQADLVRIDRSLGFIQNRTGVEVMRTQQQLNSLAQRVSQQR